MLISDFKHLLIYCVCIVIYLGSIHIYWYNHLLFARIMFFVSFNISDGNIDFVSYFYLHLLSDISKEPLTDMKRNAELSSVKLEIEPFRLYAI